MEKTMIRGDDFLIPDISQVQAITAAHPAATSILIGGQWVQVNATAQNVIAQFDAAQRAPSVGFVGVKR